MQLILLLSRYRLGNMVKILYALEKRCFGQCLTHYHFKPPKAVDIRHIEYYSCACFEHSVHCQYATSIAETSHQHCCSSNAIIENRTSFLLSFGSSASKNDTSSISKNLLSAQPSCAPLLNPSHLHALPAMYVWIVGSGRTDYVAFDRQTLCQIFATISSSFIHTTNRKRSCGLAVFHLAYLLAVVFLRHELSVNLPVLLYRLFYRFV